MTLTPWPARRRHHDRRGVGWGIIGASDVAARRFIPALRRLLYPSLGADAPDQGGTVLGIFSTNEARAEAFVAHHAIPHAYLNLADLLAQPDIDCIYIANHPRHHAQAALAALAAGKHVLCEPPLALDAEEAQRVAHTALGRGLILTVNYVRRADPAVIALREHLTDQTIGDLLTVRIRNNPLLPSARQTWRLRNPGGGVLLDRTLHSVDLLRYLLRDEIAAVYSQAAPALLGSRVEEDVTSVLTLRRLAILATVHDSFYLPHLPNQVQLIGSRGALTACHCWTDDQPSTLTLQRHGADYPLTLTAEDPFAVALRSFHAAIAGIGPTLASGVDGVQSLQVIEAAQASLTGGRRVTLEAPSRAVTDRSLL